MALGPELIFAQAGELKREYAGRKVRRADAGDSWLALGFSGERHLLFSWDAECYGVCAAQPEEIRQLQAAASSRPPLCGAVRSHLAGAELVDARALGRDRVLLLTFRRAVGAGIYQYRGLLLEASGRYSNLILLEADNDADLRDGGDVEALSILEVAKHIHPDTNRYRSVLPGGRYRMPPAIRGVALDAWDCRAENALDEVGRIAGIGRPLSEAIRATCMSNRPEADWILCGVDCFRENRETACHFTYQALGSYITLYPYALDGAAALDERTPLEAARRAVVLPIVRCHLERYRSRIAARLDHLRRNNGRKISEYEAYATDHEAAERMKLYGQLILANSWNIPPRAAEAELSEWTEAGEVRHRIPLNPDRDAAQNADRYFAKYRKKRASAERAEAHLPKLYLERAEIEEQFALLACHTDLTTLMPMMEELEAAAAAGHSGKPGKSGKSGGQGRKSVKSSGRREEALPPHRRYEIPWADAVLFFGLSARGNHYVTFRIARSDDLWLHAQGIPGAHVILRLGSRPESGVWERILALAASCAAYYSKARETGRVRVDYTERRHVRAIPGGGLAHVTYKEFSTFLADASLFETFAKDYVVPGERGE